MIRALSIATAILVAAAGHAEAQAAVTVPDGYTTSAYTAPEPPPPDFGPSIALHVTAAIAAPVGTIAIAAGSLVGLGCAFGGGSCESASWLLVGGAVFFVASIAIGISATVVHFSIRSSASRMAARFDVLPLAWGDANAGGAGLMLRTSF
jgi:hypothetical protein